MKNKPEINPYVQKFFYWIEERHNIFLKRQDGESPPWTDDPILQKYKFTNPFRQNDRVTRELAVRLEELGTVPDSVLLWAVILFRMFNHPATYDALEAYVRDKPWNNARTKKLLHDRADMREQVFTGAYIITNSGSTRPKIDLICEALGKLYVDRVIIVDEIKRVKSLEMAVKILCRYDMIGAFVAYEIVTDLRHTRILNKATDIFTWANPGPGARRGANRLFSPSHRFNDNTRNRSLPWATTKNDRLIDDMRALLKLAPHALPKKFPKLEMRDIEHSLCEFDKYMRVLRKEGRPRSMFFPSKEKLP